MKMTFDIGCIKVIIIHVEDSYKVYHSPSSIGPFTASLLSRLINKSLLRKPNPKNDNL